MSKKAKILLVESDSQLSDVVLHLLTARGHDVIAVSDPQSALDIVASVEFDVMVTCLRLGLTDGIALSETVKLRQPGLCAIVVSGGYPSVLLHRHPVVDAFIPKPFNIGMIDDVIQMICAPSA